MLTIHKYMLHGFPIEEIFMPEGAKILHVDVQYQTPCLWALVDPVKSMVTRRFHILMTGQALLNAKPEDYVGTYQLDGPFVGHIFEVK